jgi:hypothetical protein
MVEETNGHRGDFRPVPDPTVLTTEASVRQEAMIRNLIAAEIEHQRELFDEKMDGISNQFAARVLANHEKMDGIANQYNAKLEGIVNQYGEKLDGIINLYGEKIEKINIRFNMLDARTAEQKSDTKAALDAALAAQKEAVAAQTESSDKSINKSETATTERIKAVETLLNASTRASDDKIDDLKSRVGQIEAAKLGAAESTASMRTSGMDSRAVLAIAISAILALIALAAVVVAIVKP